MRNPGSYLTVFAEDKRFRKITFNGVRFEDAQELDCFTCQHCNTVVAVKPMTDPADAGGLCKHCMGLICSRCVDLGVCHPFEKKLEEHDRRARFLKSLQEWG